MVGVYRYTSYTPEEQGNMMNCRRRRGLNFSSRKAVKEKPYPVMCVDWFDFVLRIAAQLPGTPKKTHTRAAFVIIKLRTILFTSHVSALTRPCLLCLAVSRNIILSVRRNTRFEGFLKYLKLRVTFFFFFKEDCFKPP